MSGNPQRVAPLPPPAPPLNARNVSQQPAKILPQDGAKERKLANVMAAAKICYFFLID
jgi:hypothetical protein